MEILTVLLLLVIAASEVTRLVLTHKKVTKKEHFRQKLEGTQKMIWDLEFKAFKTREIREDVRQEYDFLKSRIATLEAQIENWPADRDEAEKQTLVDQKARAEVDRDRFEEQMKRLDVEVEGSRPTNEHPDGYDGIVQQIESLQELVGMLRDWVKKV